MQVYKSRAAFLEHLPRGEKCAEIGVFSGEHAKMIAEICTPSELVLVDHWQRSPYFPTFSQRMRDAQCQEVGQMFSQSRQVRLLRMTSLEAAASFPDGYFSWVYIDADHGYEAASADCELWWPKVRDVLCGHDYKSWHRPPQTCRVKEAVDDFCVRIGRPLSAIATTTDSAWAISKEG